MFHFRKKHMERSINKSQINFFTPEDREDIKLKGVEKKTSPFNIRIFQGPI